MSNRRSVLIFIGKVIVIIIIMSSFWPFLTPSYNHALVGVANKVVPSDITLMAEDSSIIIRHEYDSMIATLPVHGLFLQYGLVVLIALIGATPGLKLRQRLKFIAVALIIMFAIHVVSMLAISKVAQSISLEHPSKGGSPLEILFISIGFDLFPVLVWVVLSFKYWWPKPKVTSGTKTPVRRRVSFKKANGSVLKS